MEPPPSDADGAGMGDPMKSIRDTADGGGQRGDAGVVMQGGGSPGEPAEGPTIADLQRCWGFTEQSYQGRI